MSFPLLSDIFESMGTLETCQSGFNFHCSNDKALTKAFCRWLGLGGAARLSLLIAAMITGRGGTATIHFEKYGSA
jgi:hypothetical protein